jgi:hypothetical protein
MSPTTSARTKLLRVERKKFPLIVGSDIVPDETANNISRLLRVIHRTSIPDDWNWSWQVNNGKYRGKMPRRLRNLCGVKRLCDPVEHILMRCREDMPKPSIYVMDVTFNIDWKDGAFGDGGSCYWLGNKERIEMMDMCGFGAVRRFNVPNHIKATDDNVMNKLESRMDRFSGYGRAWLAPDKPYTGMMTIYNSYPSGWYISECADLLCKILPEMMGDGCQYTHMKTYISPTGSSTLYLNGDSRTIGTHEQMKQWLRMVDSNEDTPTVPVRLERMEINAFK